ncbi:hypothetical protein cyc_09230 [Cyclospora cayetanensis]|uniref:Uncharacterized protein n=1 Tax=Cyclospora cayetanensis TaxID=88456 RepID=A0A1D3D9P6_9EIME|nr:hypothetical protein cyc_09230 [Cyclospora cayetanensis]
MDALQAQAADHTPAADEETQQLPHLLHETPPSLLDWMLRGRRAAEAQVERLAGVGEDSRSSSGFASYKDKRDTAKRRKWRPLLRHALLHLRSKGRGVQAATEGAFENAGEHAEATACTSTAVQAETFTGVGDREIRILKASREGVRSNSSNSSGEGSTGDGPIVGGCLSYVQKDGDSTSSISVNTSSGGSVIRTACSKGEGSAAAFSRVLSNATDDEQLNLLVAAALLYSLCALYPAAGVVGKLSGGVGAAATLKGNLSSAEWTEAAALSGCKRLFQPYLWMLLQQKQQQRHTTARALGVYREALQILFVPLLRRLFANACALMRRQKTLPQLQRHPGEMLLRFMKG